MLSLKWLNLGSNALKGEVPTEIGMLADLTHLDMASNQLSYELPSEIEKLIRLKEMLVQDNKLLGPGAPYHLRLACLKNGDIQHGRSLYV